MRNANHKSTAPAANLVVDDFEAEWHLHKRERAIEARKTRLGHRVLDEAFDLAASVPANGGHMYLIDWNFTPVSGEAFPVIGKFSAIPRMSG